MARWRLPLAALIGLVTVAGCSSAGNTGEGPGPTSAATSTTSTISPSTSTSTASTASGSSDGYALGVSIGQAIAAAGSGSMTVTSSQGGTKSDAHSQFVIDSTGNLSSKATASQGGSTADIVSTTDDVYLTGAPASVSKGKTWVKIGSKSSDAVGQAMGQSARVLANPLVLLAGLLDGKETVLVEQGDVRHYRTTGGAAGTVDFYVDSQNRPTKVSTSDGTLVVTFADWGTPVSVTLPDAADVTTLS